MKQVYIKDDKGAALYTSDHDLSRSEMKRLAKRFRAKNGPAGDVTVHRLIGKDGYANLPLVVLRAKGSDTPTDPQS